MTESKRQLRESWLDRVRRWLQEHRTFAACAAAVLLLGLVGSVVVATITTAKDRQIAKQTQRALVREQIAIEVPTDFGGVVGEGDRQDPPRLFQEEEAVRGQASRGVSPGAEFQRSLAASHNNAGRHQSEMGHPDRALESYGKALLILEPLSRENASVPAIQSELARSYVGIGLVQSETGHPDRALKSYGEALAIHERLARENPGVTAFQKDLAQSHHSIGFVQSTGSLPERALKSYGEALAIRERLAREHSDLPDYASDLAATLNNMAAIDLGAKRFEQGRDKLLEAVSWQEKALATNPSHPHGRQILRNYLTNLLMAANGLGNADDAAAAQHMLDKLAASDPANGSQ